MKRVKVEKTRAEQGGEQGDEQGDKLTNLRDVIETLIPGFPSEKQSTSNAVGTENEVVLVPLFSKF